MWRLSTWEKFRGAFATNIADSIAGFPATELPFKMGKKDSDGNIVEYATGGILIPKELLVDM